MTSSASRNARHKVAKIRWSAPGPSPATTHPVGAWSAMPGRLPGIGCSLHKP